jgi:hypothetical protein
MVSAGSLWPSYVPHHLYPQPLFGLVGIFNIIQHWVLNYFLTSVYKHEKLDNKKVRDYLNAMTSVNHYDWPIKSSHFCFWDHFGDHCYLCIFRSFNFISHYVKATLHPEYCVQAIILLVLELLRYLYNKVIRKFLKTSN